MPKGLQIVFARGAISIAQALQRLASVLARHDVPLNGYALYGATTHLAEAERRLQASGKKAFDIEGHGFEFRFASLARHDLDFFQIETKRTDVEWDEWVEEFASTFGFTMAWLYDVEYHDWQNVKDPQQYERAGRSYSHLPMRRSELPAPLDRMEVDTSRNPGRYILQGGYVETIGAIMWLGKPFWELTGANLEAVRSANWLHVSEPIRGVARVQAAEKPFDSAEGESGAIQENLRALLFSRSRQSLG